MGLGAVLYDTNTCSLCSITFSATGIFNILTALDPVKACGPDGIPGKLLGECAFELSHSLTVIFDSSLLQGKVLSALKLANVTTVFKKIDKTSVENYRPISVPSHAAWSPNFQNAASTRNYYPFYRTAYTVNYFRWTTRLYAKSVLCYTTC